MNDDKEWIDIKRNMPFFGEPVLAYCRTYGRFMACYERIDDSDHGQWCNWTGEKGILPPTHWWPLPQPPKEK